MGLRMQGMWAMLWMTCVLTVATIGCGAAMQEGPYVPPTGPQSADCTRPSRCYDEAAEVCPRGYRLLDKTQDVVPGLFGNPPMMRTTLLYECKKATGASASARE